MADAHNLSADALVRKVLTDDHADLVREAVGFLCQQIMEAEVSAQVGAGLGERAPQERATQRNGYRPRRWDTRAGSLELFIPKLRAGSYFPSFLEPRTRSEQALVAVVMEAYVNGVSTRKVERVVEQLGVAGMSKSQVSRLCAALDEQVAAFRERPLEGRYPYLWLDAKVEKVRGPDGRGAPQGPGGGLRRPRGGIPRGDRPRCRRHRVGGLLARVPAIAGGPWPYRR
jgi:putative transposase